MITLESILNKIMEKEIELNLDNFEATDSEGHSMEGGVVYNGEEHYVYLAYMNEDSYELQAAKQIYADLVKQEGRYDDTEITVEYVLNKLKNHEIGVSMDCFAQINDVGNVFSGPVEYLLEHNVTIRCGIETDYHQQIAEQICENLKANGISSEADYRISLAEECREYGFEE